MQHLVIAYHGPTATPAKGHRYRTVCCREVFVQRLLPTGAVVELPGDGARCPECFPERLVDEDGDAAALDPSLGGLEDGSGLGDAECDHEGTLEEVFDDR